MKLLKFSHETLTGLDRLALAFGYLAEPTPNNSIKDISDYDKHAKRCSDCYAVDQKQYATDDCGTPSKERCEPGKKLLDKATRFQVPTERGEVCQYVLFHPHDFYYFMSNYGVNFLHHFDRETQQKLVRRGIVGYIWGATCLLDEEIPRGHICLSTDARERVLVSKQSVLIELGFPEMKDMKYIVEDCPKSFA